MLRILIALSLTIFAATAHAEIDIKQVKSPNGVNAWFVEEHSIPFIALELRFRGGASLDLPGKRGATYVPRGAICLETQHFPDSPNKPEFPSTVLEPGDVYRSTTVYAFSVAEDL